MSQSKHQGAIQSSTFQGAIQEQAQDFSDTLNDTISLSDALQDGAGLSLSDTLQLSEPKQTYCVYCDGTYHMVAGNSSVHDIGTEDIGLRTWVKLPASVGTTYIGSKGSGNTKWILYHNTSGAPIVTLSAGVSDWTMTATGVDLRGAGWKYLAFIIDRDNESNCKIFVDGVAVSVNYTGSLAAQVGSISNAGYFQLGAIYLGGGPFDGQMSQAVLCYPADIMAAGEMGDTGKILADYNARCGTPGFNYEDRWQLDEGSGTTINGEVADLTLSNVAAWLLDYGPCEGPIADAAIVSADTITLSEELIADAVADLSDLITLAEELFEGTRVNLSDTVVLTEAITLAAAHGITDSLSLLDNLTAGMGLVLDDTITLAEDLIVGMGFTLSDIISITDLLTILGVGTADLTDSLTLSDVLSAVLGSGIITPGTADYSEETIPQKPKQPRTWRKTVSNEPSPVSALSQSSSNTTFTQKTVTDSSAWDLTQIAVGDVAITTSKYLGIILSIGANVITVAGWRKAGITRVLGATEKPADGETVTIHRLSRATKLLIRPSGNNNGIIYVGFDPNVTPETGHPVPIGGGQINSALPIEAPRDRWLNTSKVWVVSGTTQEVILSAGAGGGGAEDGQGSGQSGAEDSQTQSDSMSLNDSLSVNAGHLLEDNITLSDELTPNAVIPGSVLGDGISMSDNLSGVLTPGGVPGPVLLPGLNDVVVDGNYAYICGISGSNGILAVFDISNPASPSRIGYLTFASAGPGYRISKLDDYVYVTTNTGILKIDVSTPSSPSEDTHTVLTAGTLSISSVFINGPERYAYVMSPTKGLKIVDADTMAIVPNSMDTETNGTQYAYDILAGGSYDLSYPWTPHGAWGRDNYVTFAGGSWCIVDGNDVYLAGTTLWKLDKSGGHNSMTISHIWNVIKSSTTFGSSWRSPILLFGGKIFAHIASTSPQPYSFQELNASTNDINNNFHLTSGYAGELFGKCKYYNSPVPLDTMFILRDQGYSVADLSSPSELNDVTIASRGFDISGNYAYILVWTIGNHRMEIYDISDVASWSLTGTGT